MNEKDDWKYALFGALAVAAVVVGSLLIGAAVDDDGGDDIFGRAVLVTIGSSLSLFGIATAVASITTYLVRRR